MSGSKTVALVILLASSPLAGCGSDEGSDPVGGGGGGSTSRDGSASDARPDSGDAARNDASQDAADRTDAPTGPLDEAAAAILAAKSGQCLACATSNCSSLMIRCGALDGKATSGPAAGTSRAELCLETLACAVSTGCAAISTQVCYCGGVLLPDPLTNCVKEETPCFKEIERSYEVTNASSLFKVITDESRAGSWATALMQCLRDYRCTSCLEKPIRDSGSPGMTDARGPDPVDTGVPPVPIDSPTIDVNNPIDAFTFDATEPPEDAGPGDSDTTEDGPAEGDAEAGSDADARSDGDAGSDAGGTGNEAASEGGAVDASRDVPGDKIDANDVDGGISDAGADGG